MELDKTLIRLVIHMMLQSLSIAWLRMYDILHTIGMQGEAEYYVAGINACVCVCVRICRVEVAKDIMKTLQLWQSTHPMMIW